jgi:hypothetical protein
MARIDQHSRILRSANHGDVAWLAARLIYAYRARKLTPSLIWSIVKEMRKK